MLDRAQSAVCPATSYVYTYFDPSRTRVRLSFVTRSHENNWHLKDIMDANAVETHPKLILVEEESTRPLVHDGQGVPLAPI